MKTIEQAAIEYRQTLNDSGVLLSNTVATFKAGVEFAQRWIPVEEESPSEYEYVLAKRSVGDVYVACFSDYTFHTGMPHKVNITHWRPIEYK